MFDGFNSFGDHHRLHTHMLTGQLLMKLDHFCMTETVLKQLSSPCKNLK